MVELVVSTFKYISKLEQQLIDANIEYQLRFDLGHYGIRPPYIIVDGVPLDGKRARRWIKEYKRDDY